MKLTSRNIFLIIALILTAILGIFSYYISKRQFEKYVTETYINSLHQSINNIASDYFDFASFGSLKASSNQSKFITRLSEEPGMKGLKITDANGVIIASTSTAEVNSSLLEDAAWKSAVTGNDLLEKVSLEGKTATTYIPLISDNDVVKGVVIADLVLPSSFLTIESFANSVVLIIVLSALVFILVAYVIMYELEDRMAEKERSVFDQSRAQAEEKQLYEAITTSIAESLIVINKNNQIMMLNPEAESLLGRKGNTIEYRSYEKFISFYNESGKKIHKDPIGEALKSGKKVHISSKDKFHIKNQDNHLVPVTVNISPVVGDKSFIKGVALTIIDISTEEELQKVKDDFVYVVAHELGNPIFALDGYLSLLHDRRKKLDKQSTEILDRAQNINQQLSSLVNDLLEVARSETGRLTFDLEKINVSSIAKEAIKFSQFKASEKDIKIKSKITPSLVATGNERKIREVLINLVDNAIKYTPKGGSVQINVFGHENRIITSVADNGIGLSKEAQQHLFEKFYRVRNKETAGISGTGLGLFIAKQIVEKCHGEIWASSEEDKGSTFSFSLKTKNQERKVTVEKK